MSMNQIASDLYKAISESDQRKVKPYDVKAEVLRTEGDIVWVKIPGGIDETPVQRTNNANPGDEVIVRVAGGRAWLLGNNTSPATDDTTANLSLVQAGEALVGAKEAQDLANIAYSDAVRAHEAADEAMDSAERAEQSAIEAKASAAEALEDAATAQEAANSAETHAQAAISSASQANTAANAAITQLSVVEDVVGVLEWVSTHATYEASTDTSVVPAKLYFTRSGSGTEQDPYVYTPVANPTGNPSINNYYEIDSINEAVTNYVSSHLALTNDGLWVVNDNNSYKILLSSSGMKVYDKNGNLVSTFGEQIIFSSTRAQSIGGENAYILFNPTDGSMSIGGSRLNLSGNITISGTSKTLSQVLADMQAEIDGSIETWYYAVDPTTSNPPAVNWTTQEQKENHLRDLYFNTTNGHSFRWAYENNEFKWVQIADEDAAAALRAAQAAQATADNAIKYVEYAVGDSSTTPPSTGWSTTSPTWEEGKYVWMRQSKNGTNYTYTCIQGAKGEDGEAGPDATVTINLLSADWQAGTGVLGVTLRVNGVITTPTSYKWTKNEDKTVLGTGPELIVTDEMSLNGVYNCTVTW